MTRTPVIAITVGEPAGIGPEISIRGAWECRKNVIPVLIGDYEFLEKLAQKIDPDIVLKRIDRINAETLEPSFCLDEIYVIDCPLQQPVAPGKLNPANGITVLNSLDIAIEGALKRTFDAIVTAPVQKSTINDSGIAFTGHTEYLAEKTATKQVVMMLAGPTKPMGNDIPGFTLRVALATTHLPVKSVSNAITIASLTDILSIIDNDLRNKFGLVSPRILVTGLNPHAGENGYLGMEEIEVITPALEQARKAGIQAFGPYPADTLFQPRYLQDADCILAMYHDQGLPVLKFATFGQGVNITLGLPIIRTSVDHGTALDIAEKGLGLAGHGSMIEAINMAAVMATHWQNNIHSQEDETHSP